MGELTSNEYFYKPALNASGASEKASFDAALDKADAEIASNKSKADANTTKFSGGTTFGGDVGVAEGTKLFLNAAKTTYLVIESGKLCIYVAGTKVRDFG